MTEAIATRWHDAFLHIVRQPQYAHPLKEASLGGNLGQWTSQLPTAKAGGLVPGATATPSPRQ
jgi:hypothetical protein